MNNEPSAAAIRTAQAITNRSALDSIAEIIDREMSLPELIGAFQETTQELRGLSEYVALGLDQKQRTAIRKVILRADRAIAGIRGIRSDS